MLFQICFNKIREVLLCIVLISTWKIERSVAQIQLDFQRPFLRQSQALPRNSQAFGFQKCRDSSEYCEDWAQRPRACYDDRYVIQNCGFSCRFCKTPTPPQYDASKLPRSLSQLGFLLGKWRSDDGGKARFPGMPVFTYGEEIDFSVGESASPVLNYTAFAWGFNTQEELHGEIGYISASDSGNQVALTAIMNNGFTTVEQGSVRFDTLKLSLGSIGRVSFGRDLEVTNMAREFKSEPSGEYLNQIMFMETITASLQEHTRIRYKKVYP